MLRRDDVGREHFKTPTFLPIVAALTCAFLVGPWARNEEQQQQYEIAGILLGLGILLWVVTWFINRAVYAKKTYMRDPEHIDHD